MATAKDIIVKVIPSDVAHAFVAAHHYSGTTTKNSVLHFGVFLDGELHGAIQLGQGIDKRKTIGLVKNTAWDGYLEINRMAFDDKLPQHSESRALGVLCRLIKKQAPQVKWLLSYADATQCGDGTIYRAAGFLLTQVKKNTLLWRLPDGKVVSFLVFQAAFGRGSANELKVRYGKVGEYASWDGRKFLKHIGATELPGYQLRYIKLLDPTCELGDTFKVLPYSVIDELKVGMYRGEKIARADRRPQQEAPAS